jgi:hypothetical protein
VCLIKYSKYLVYKLPDEWRQNPYSVGEGISYIELKSKDTIKQLFSYDEILQRTFCEFLEKGFYGIAWYNQTGWMSYAWMSLPETLGPPHLPRKVQMLPFYWIFYCRTREEYRGHGLYKASLNILCNLARRQDPNAEIYIDTDANNLPSRKAIEAVGFIPAGVITMYSLRIPKIRTILLKWSWNKEAKHPEAKIDE